MELVICERAAGDRMDLAADLATRLPASRRHHRIKQAPGWHLDQPQPGLMRWTTPSGRVHTTRPTIYDT